MNRARANATTASVTTTLIGGLVVLGGLAFPGRIKETVFGAVLVGAGVAGRKLFGRRP